MVLTSSDYCKNCKYYRALYTKENTRFKSLMGYCCNDDIEKRKIRKIDPCLNYCEFWVKCEDKTDEQKESIREAICDMRKKLTQILAILENKE